MLGKTALFLIAIAILQHEVTSTELTDKHTTTTPLPTSTASTPTPSTSAPTTSTASPTTTSSSTEESSSTPTSTASTSTAPPVVPVYNITGLTVSYVSPCILNVSWTSNCTSKCNFTLTYTGSSKGSNSTSKNMMELAALPGGSYKVCVAILTYSTCANHNVTTEAPGKVHNVTFAKNPRNLTVNWIPATSYICTAETKGYMLTLQKSVSSKQNITVPPTSTNHTFSKLEPCTEYTVSVDVISDVANTSSGNMTVSTSIEAPSTPVVSAVAISPDTLHVNWTVPDVSNCKISSFIVIWKSVAGNSTGNITLGSDKIEHSIGNLTEASAYTVSVTAVTTYDNTSLESEPTSVDVATCGPIISLNKTKQNSCGFLLSWENNCPQSYNYTVSWKGPKNGSNDTTKMSKTFLDLPTGEYYLCVNSTWKSTDFKCLNASIEKEAGKVENVTFVKHSRNVTVKWTPPKEYSCTVPTKGYILTLQKTENASAKQSFNVSSKSTNYTVKMLEPCTEYTVSVEVKSELSNTSSVNTTVSTSIEAPPKPNITTGDIFPGSLNINWASSNVSNCNISNYIVQWRMSDGNSTSNITLGSDQKKYSIGNLTETSKYSVSVTAVTTYDNASLNSVPSLMNISTCGPITSLKRPEQNSCGFLLSWENTCKQTYNYTITWQGQTNGSINTNKTTETIPDLLVGNYSLCLNSSWNTTDLKCYNTSVKPAPGEVQNVTFANHPRKLTVMWAPAKNYSCTVATKGYMLTIQKSEKGYKTQSFNVSSKSTNYTFTKLDPCTGYTVSVDSIAAVANSSSGNKTVSTSIEAPGIPETTARHKSDSITVKWKQPKLNPCPIDHYNVSWVAKNSSSKGHTIAVNGTSYTITGLKPKTTYGINVTAIVSYQNTTATNSSSELQESTGGASSTSGNMFLFNVIFIAFLNICFASS